MYIVLCGLLVVHRIEVVAGVTGLDGWEEIPESILETASAQWPVSSTMYCVEHTSSDRYVAAVTPFRPLYSSRHHP